MTEKGIGFDEFTALTHDCSQKLLLILQETRPEEVGNAAMLALLGAYSQVCDPAQKTLLIESLRSLANAIEAGVLEETTH